MCVSMVIVHRKLVENKMEVVIKNKKYNDKKLTYRVREIAPEFIEVRPNLGLLLSPIISS